MRPRRPPALVLKTTAVTFATAALLLTAIFIVVTFSVRQQVRGAVRDQLESSQRMIAAIQEREQRDLRLQAAGLAESPTLKAAVDTFAAEAASASPFEHQQLLNTMARELDRVSSLIDVDALIVVDRRGTTLAAAGPLAGRWPIGHAVPLVNSGPESSDGVVHMDADIFRIIVVPLIVDDTTAIGALYLATRLDRQFAAALGELARTETAIVSNGRLVASTLADGAAPAFEAAVGSMRAVDGTVVLNGETHAFRQLVPIGDTVIYALASIDAAASPAVSAVNRALTWLAVAAGCVALLASWWLARLLGSPIGALSASIDRMTRSKDFATTLPVTGSSVEVDRLTHAFNGLMASVTAAEGETQAAYTAAIRALAAALDARDPYTAGHSERVSTLSVAIGQAMGLSGDDLEVLRLGALLHDIGKIGVPDDILRKPGGLTDAEFEIIKQHPVLGARILRNVPFLSRHLPIVELHHERPDGNGYPFGLRSDDIPLAAHIVHVADAFDAMTSARAYRSERPASHAFRELWAGAGTDFYAEAVVALTRALPALASEPTPILPEALSA